MASSVLLPNSNIRKFYVHYGTLVAEILEKIILFLGFKVSERYKYKLKEC